MFRVDLRAATANKVTALPTEARQDLLRQLGQIAELVSDRGLEGLQPVLNLWFDYGQWRVLYSLDVRKRVLAFIDLIPKNGT